MNLVHPILAGLFAVLFAVFFVYVAFQLKSPDVDFREKEPPGSNSTD